LVDGGPQRGAATGRDAPPRSPDPSLRERDRRLVAAVLGKNRKAAAEFVGRFSDPVYRYVHFRLMPRADLVDDVVQEVFLAAWDSLESFRGTSSLKSWILGIARHKVEAHYRKELRRSLSFDSDEDVVTEVGEPPRLDSELDRRRTLEATRRVLRDMPESYRLLLLWRYWDRRSLADIGRALGKTEKAIERALARARRDFKRRWDDR
jgi:RNA polymerase sigma-70 factor (ECF subfamily)